MSDSSTQPAAPNPAQCTTRPAAIILPQNQQAAPSSMSQAPQSAAAPPKTQATPSSQPPTTSALSTTDTLNLPFADFLQLRFPNLPVGMLQSLLCGQVDQTREAAEAEPEDVRVLVASFTPAELPLKCRAPLRKAFEEAATLLQAETAELADQQSAILRKKLEAEAAAASAAAEAAQQAAEQAQKDAADAAAALQACQQQLPEVSNTAQPSTTAPQPTESPEATVVSADHSAKSAPSSAPDQASTTSIVPVPPLPLALPSSSSSTEVLRDQGVYNKVSDSSYKSLQRFISADSISSESDGSGESDQPLGRRPTNKKKSLKRAGKRLSNAMYTEIMARYCENYRLNLSSDDLPSCALLGAILYEANRDSLSYKSFRDVQRLNQSSIKVVDYSSWAEFFWPLFHAYASLGLADLQSFREHAEVVRRYSRKHSWPAVQGAEHEVRSSWFRLSCVSGSAFAPTFASCVADPNLIKWTNSLLCPTQVRTRQAPYTGPKRQAKRPRTSSRTPVRSGTPRRASTTLGPRRSTGSTDLSRVIDGHTRELCNNFNQGRKCAKEPCRFAHF